MHNIVKEKRRKERERYCTHEERRGWRDKKRGKDREERMGGKKREKDQCIVKREEREGER